LSVRRSGIAGNACRGTQYVPHRRIASRTGFGGRSVGTSRMSHAAGRRVLNSVKQV